MAKQMARRRGGEVNGRSPTAPALPVQPDVSAHDVVVVGASAGGGEALAELVRYLPTDIPAAVFVVVQLPDTIRGAIPALLARAGALPVGHPADGDPICNGHIYVAPPGFHLIVEPGRIRIFAGPRENGLRPSIDVLFRSAAVAYDGRVVGVVLSGTLDGGTLGLLAIKRAGGVAIVQEPEDALYSSMPLAALQHVAVDHRLAAAQMAPVLVHLAAARPAPQPVA
jgi:two-component system chemotaxis response regulator CheB